MKESSGIAIAKALSHPTRVRILMAMNTPQRRLSPVGFSDESGEVLSKAAYHFRELNKSGVIRLVDKIPRRGSFEHVYETERRAMAWTKTWAALPPLVKQTFTATVLGGFVEAVGAAVDEGTFEERKDSHFSWTSMRVDQTGWEKLIGVLNRTLEELMDIERESAARLGEDDSGFVASYALAGFEAPSPER